MFFANMPLDIEKIKKVIKDESKEMNNIEVKIVDKIKRMGFNNFHFPRNVHKLKSLSLVLISEKCKDKELIKDLKLYRSLLNKQLVLKKLIVFLESNSNEIVPIEYIINSMGKATIKKVCVPFYVPEEIYKIINLKINDLKNINDNFNLLFEAYHITNFFNININSLDLPYMWYLLQGEQLYILRVINNEISKKHTPIIKHIFSEYEVLYQKIA